MPTLAGEHPRLVVVHLDEPPSAPPLPVVQQQRAWSGVELHLSIIILVLFVLLVLVALQRWKTSLSHRGATMPSAQPAPAVSRPPAAGRVVPIAATRGQPPPPPNLGHLDAMEKARVGALRALPRYRWAGGGAHGDECVLCIESYQDGDTLRLLPCNHYYHQECIDQWLIVSQQNCAQRACPLCKANPIPTVIKPIAEPIPRVDAPQASPAMAAASRTASGAPHSAAPTPPPPASPVRNAALSESLPNMMRNAADAVASSISRHFSSAGRVAPRLTSAERHGSSRAPSTSPLPTWPARGSARDRGSAMEAAGDVPLSPWGARLGSDIDSLSASPLGSETARMPAGRRLQSAGPTIVVQLPDAFRGEE